MKLLKSLLVGLAMTFASPVISQTIENDPIQDLSVQETVFFPSDGTDISGTMLQMDATVTLSVIHDNDYILSFCYAVDRYEGRLHGNVDDITVRADFSGSLANLQYPFKLFKMDEFRLNEGVKVGDKHCQVVFVISKTGRWHVDNLPLVIYDKQYNREAVYTIPVFVPND